MPLLVNQDFLESPLEDVSGTSVVPVEELGIDAVDLAHAEGEVRIRCLDEKVIMVVHETVGMAEPIVLPDRRSEDGEKLLPVGIIREDLSPSISTGGDMIDSARGIQFSVDVPWKIYIRS